MTIRYKNEAFKQSGTGAVDQLTCPADGVIIIKSIYVQNTDTTSAIDVFISLKDSDGTGSAFFYQSLAAKTQVNAAPQGINLEAGDAIRISATTGSDKIQGIISYALIDRSQENG